MHLGLSLVKRWLMGTMQGSVSPEHAIAGDPVTYQSLREGRTHPHTSAATARTTSRATQPGTSVGRPELAWRHRPTPVSI